MVFSQMLIISYILLSMLFVIMTFFSKTTSEAKKWARTRLIHVCVLVVLAAEVVYLLLAMSNPPAFKLSVGYITGVAVLAAAIVTLVKSSRSFLLLPLLLIFHVVFLYDHLLQLNISERVDIAVLMGKTGRYVPGSVRHIYEPFPVHLFLQYVVPSILGFREIGFMNPWLYYIVFIIAYDLVIFTLVRNITKSNDIAFLSVLILLLTPPANIIRHLAKWPGNLLVLVAILVLIKRWEERNLSLGSLIVIILCYIAAILFHPSATIFLLFSAILIFVIFLTSRDILLQRAK